MAPAMTAARRINGQPADREALGKLSKTLFIKPDNRFCLFYETRIAVAAVFRCQLSQTKAHWL